MRPGVGARASRGPATAGSAKERTGKANNDLRTIVIERRSQRCQKKLAFGKRKVVAGATVEKAGVGASLYT